MKTLKKVLSLVLVAVVLLPVALVAGCSAKGSWKVAEATVGDTTYTRKEYNKTYGKDNFDYENATDEEKAKALAYVTLFAMEYNLKKDGTVELKVNVPEWAKEEMNEEEATESLLKWKETDETVELYGEIAGIEMTIMKLTKDGLKLVGDMGEAKIVLK